MALLVNLYLLASDVGFLSRIQQHGYGRPSLGGVRGRVPHNIHQSDVSLYFLGKLQLDTSYVFTV